MDGHDPLFDARLTLPGEGPPVLEEVPRKRGVYVFEDEAGRAVQILCAGNIHASIGRRLEEFTAEGKRKRLSYQGFARSVAWRLTPTPLLMNLWLVECYRARMPEQLSRRLRLDAPWFVSMTRRDGITLLEVTSEPGEDTWGPFVSRRRATGTIEALQDAFDLCRTQDVLLKTPHGKACAYKSLGRCPAPCDGSVGLDVYLKGTVMAREFLSDPAAGVAKAKADVAEASGRQAFELAGQRHQFAVRLEAVVKKLGPARPMPAWEHLVIQRGPGVKRVHLVAIGRSGVWPVGAMAIDTQDVGDVVSEVRAWGRQRGEESDVAKGLLGYHLRHEPPWSESVPLPELTPARLKDALAALRKAPDTQDKGSILTEDADATDRE